MKSSYPSHWNVLPPPPAEYIRVAGVPPIIAQFLYNRGVEPHAISAFLTIDDRLQVSPFLLPDMTPAVSRIYTALLTREKIAVYGDLDVDGVTATAVLVESLTQLGGDVITYIPDRFSEGHGLKSAGIQTLRSQGARLIITVDCGVSDLAETKQAQSMGIDMIVTDHHNPLPTLPSAVAVIDAKRQDSRYPFSELAGVGVAFKLAQALLYKHGEAQRLTDLLDLVALGTVADLVSLTGENRRFVKDGLKVLNTTGRVGLREMIQLAGLRQGQVDAEDIAWALGPRLNAAGRIDTATTSYRLLTTQSVAEARALARELEDSNRERKRVASEALCHAKQRLDGKFHLPLLMECDESYPVGVIGLVAGKLTDEFYRPAVIVKLDPELCRGSGRSIPEFNLADALAQCHDLLAAFGGHPSAAGFAVAPQNLAQLEERLTLLAQEQLSHLDLRPKLNIDAEISLSALTGDTLNLMRQLEPFGQGNPCPTLLSPGVEVIEHHSLGDQGQWLALKLKQGDVVWRAVDFESHKRQDEITPLIDAVYNIGRNQWNGEEVLELRLLDFAPSV